MASLPPAMALEPAPSSASRPLPHRPSLKADRGAIARTAVPGGAGLADLEQAGCGGQRTACSTAGSLHSGLGVLFFFYRFSEGNILLLINIDNMNTESPRVNQTYVQQLHIYTRCDGR